MARQEFPRSVRVEAIKRCTDKKGIRRCEGCDVALKAGGFAFDHVTADGLGGKPVLSNCQVLCTGPNSCHDRKTREQDVPAIAKAKRNEAKHLGVAKPKKKMQGPGFGKPEAQRTASRPLNKWRGF